MRQIAVIGAGIVGTACAIDLQQRGWQVTLIDRQGPGLECSYGNAGILAIAEIFPLISPARLVELPRSLLGVSGPAIIRPAAFPSLLPWLFRAAATLTPRRQREIGSALTMLNRRALPAWRSLLDHCGLADQLVARGMLEIARGAKGFAALEARAACLREHAFQATLIGPGALNELEPALDSASTAAIWHEGVAHVRDPHQLVVRLAETFAQRGGTMLRRDVRMLRRCNGTIDLIAGEERFSCDHVLVAAGLGSASLLRPFGVKVPLQAERGYHLTVNRGQHLLRRPIAFHRESCVATPLDGGTRLAGTVEFAPVGAVPRWERAQRLAGQVQPYFRACLAADPDTQWVGERPSFPDSLPAIGRLRSAPHIFYCFGHQHLGLTQAAVSAELVADMICERSAENKLFDLKRFT